MRNLTKPVSPESSPSARCRLCDAQDQALEGNGGFRKQCVDKGACSERLAAQRSAATTAHCIYCGCSDGLVGDGPRKRCKDERACGDRVRGADPLPTTGARASLSVVRSTAPARDETPAETMIALLQQRANVAALSGPVLYGNEESFPIEALQVRNVVLGKTGCGKTGAITVIAENCLLNNVPLVILDFLGNLWGIRARGTREGLAIAIAGGPFADIPLQIDDAERCARLIAAGASILLDLSEYALDQQQWFAARFFTELLRVLRRPAHIIADEADTIAASFTRGKAQFASQGPVTLFARQIRRWGVGWTFASQRSSLLHPDIIASSNAFIAMQATGDDVQRKIGKETATRVGSIIAGAILSELGRLRQGETWLVPDPAWLGGEHSAPMRFRFRRRFTHDSTAVPRIGETLPAAPALVPVDLRPFKSLLRNKRTRQ